MIFMVELLDKMIYVWNVLLFEKWLFLFLENIYVCKFYNHRRDLKRADINMFKYDLETYHISTLILRIPRC